MHNNFWEYKSLYTLLGYAPYCTIKIHALRPAQVVAIVRINYQQRGPGRLL